MVRRDDRAGKRTRSQLGPASDDGSTRASSTYGSGLMVQAVRQLILADRIRVMMIITNLCVHAANCGRQQADDVTYLAPLRLGLERGSKSGRDSP